MEASQLLPHHLQNYLLLVFVLEVKILGDGIKHKPLLILILLLLIHVMFVREVFFLMVLPITTTTFLIIMMNCMMIKKKKMSKWVPFECCNTTIAITGVY
jgi:hypothetical protein